MAEEAERAEVEEKEGATTEDDKARPSDPPTGPQSARAGLGEGGGAGRARARRQQTAGLLC